MSRLEQGPLTGSYARDVRVIVYDGKMHPVDSNEIYLSLIHIFNVSDDVPSVTYPLIVNLRLTGFCTLVFCSRMYLSENF